MDSLEQSLVKLIKIESVKSEPAPGAPFGERIKQALDFALELGQKMGFAARDFEGYAGEIEFGQGEPVLAVLAHLDVVPLGNGWTKEQGQIENGNIYGRGAVDDKGPALAVLYAMHELKQEGFTPKRAIRLILGCDEESGSRCMEYYKSLGRMPEEGFSPDADFPLVICEKTILQLQLNVPAPELKDKGVIKFYGGHRVNMVPDFAALIMTDSNGGQIKNEFMGTSAHGSTPHEGDNAIWKLLEHLKGDKVIDNIIKYLASKEALQNSGLYKEDSRSGAQTLNLGTIEYDAGEGVIKLGLDFRCPISQDPEKIKSSLTQLFPASQLSVKHFSPYLYADPESSLVKNLLQAYREETGDNSAPIIIGGGTYARALTRGVSFGPTFPGQKTSIHNADEFISIDNLYKIKNIYKRALEKLTR